MVNKYTVGSVVLSICLLAIFGVNRAWNWLANSAQNGLEEERVLTLSANEEEGSVLLSQADSRLEKNRVEEQFTNQSTDIPEVKEISEDLKADLEPLEAAGTLIQRQKRVELDRSVATTAVNVVPIADATPAPVTETTAAAPQVTTTTPAAATATTTPAASQPATTPSAGVVPALW